MPQTSLAPAKVHEIIEPNNSVHYGRMRAMMALFNMRTTGSSSVDAWVRPERNPLKAINFPILLTIEEVSPECQYCGEPLPTMFVYGGVVGGSAWFFLCLTCFKEEGLGIGPGRGCIYNLNGDDFERVECSGAKPSIKE